MTFDELLTLEDEQDSILREVGIALDANDHEDDVERRMLALYEHLEGSYSLDDIEEVSGWSHCGMLTFSVGSREYAVATDDEADEAWDAALDNYLEECVYPELPDFAASYFDEEKWKRDARFDGRGHCISGYDGHEYDVREFFIYRVN